MSEFKKGDIVYFFWQSGGRSVFDSEYATGLFPGDLHLSHGTIVSINPNKDYIHVYVEGEKAVCCFGYTFSHDYIFKEKEAAFFSLQKRIDDLRLRNAAT